MNKIEEKEKLNRALKEMKIRQDFKEAEKILNSHSGFEKEKAAFKESINYYIHFQGKLAPLREVFCYSGPPGTGKTTFVQTLSKAMGRELETIPCAGLTNPEEYSILGDKHKPSLVAWTMIKNGCKNPIILLDELEKVTDEKIQADLIKLFEAFKEEGVYKDPYFNEEIDLKYINFFAAVNYDQKLATKLKAKIDLQKLLGYTEKEKKDILKIKRTEMQTIYQLEKEEIEKMLSEDVLSFLVDTWIQEKGVRKLEQACHKIIEEHIIAKQTNRQAFQRSKQQWIEKNVLPFRESYKLNWRHHLLFTSLGLGLVLLITWIFTRFLLKPAEKETREKSRREDE